MEPEELAKQLRQPEGEAGIEVGKRMNDGNALMYAMLLELLDVRDEMALLEIGFGNGKFIPQTLGKAHKSTYAGVDISATMLAEAQQVIDGAGIADRATIQPGNVSTLPFPDNEFDRVFTVNTIYFWDDPSRDIREIRRVLKPGGLFLLSFRPKEQVEHLPFTKFGFRLWTVDEALELLRGAGFTRTEAVYRNEPSFEINGQQVTVGSYCLVCS